MSRARKASRAMDWVVVTVLLGLLVFGGLTGCATGGTWYMDEINLTGSRDWGHDNFNSRWQGEGGSITFTWRRYFDDEVKEESK